MPKITQITIQTKNKDRCNLFIDGEFYAGISVEAVMKFRLKVGQEVNSDTLKALIEDNERAEALAKALKYLSNRLKTKREVKDYLLKKGYSENVVWYCIDKLKDYGYIDDKEYSKRYIESVSKKQGNRLSEYKLMMKGVKKEDISLALECVDVDYNENAKQVALKHIKNKEITSENLAKTYRYLISKGFTYEQASFAVQSLKKDY